MTPGTYLLVNLATVILIRQGAIRVEPGCPGPGRRGGLVQLYGQMIIELVKLGSMVITLNKSAACANRIQSILEVKSSMTCPSADGPLQPVGQGPAVAFHQVPLGMQGVRMPFLNLILPFPRVRPWGSSGVLAAARPLW